MKNILFLVTLVILYSCNIEKPETITSKPTNLIASKGTYSNKIIVQWDLMPDANTYQLYRFDPKIGDFTVLSLTSNSTFEDSTFDINAKQYYKVRTYNSETSYSDFSDIMYGYSNLYVGNNPLIETPTHFKVSKGDYENKIVLSWARPPKAQLFQIFKFDQVSNNYILLASTENLMFEDPSKINPYTKVLYKIRVFNTDLEYSSFTETDYGYKCGQTYDLISSFGSRGSGNGQFDFPEHIAIDQLDHIYVSDLGNNNIQKFDKNGTFIEDYYSCNSPRTVLFLPDRVIIAKSYDNMIFEMDYNKQFIREWGSTGVADGQFNFLRQMALDDENNLYVVDAGNNRIQKFDLTGNFILKWGNTGENEGNFVSPCGIAFLNGQILVSSGKRVQFFTKKGVLLKQWNFNNTVYDICVHGNDIYLACESYILKTTENRDIDYRIGEGDFGTVTSMIVDSNNILIANDESNRRISFYKMK